MQVGQIGLFFTVVVAAGVVVKGPCPVGNVFTVTLGDIVFIVTLSSSSEKVDWSIVLFILDPVLVEVLVRGVALWVLVLVVEDLPAGVPAGLPCLAIVLNALLDVVSLEEAEEKDWILSFLVTFTILTISTSSLSVESEEDLSYDDWMIL